MRLFGYYAFHSAKNQLKKMLKSWVLIFILVCFVVGGLIGYGASLISEKIEENGVSLTEQEEGADELSEELFGDVETEDEVFEEEEGDFFIDDGTGKSIEVVDFVEMLVGLVTILIFGLHLFEADKAGGAIFLPADAGLLFPSPMKPQSVLLFRMMANIGATAFASIYLLFQLPNLILNAGLSPAAAGMILVVWLLTMVAARLMQVFLFTWASTRPGIKKNVRTGLIAIVAVIAVVYYVYFLRMQPLNYVGAAAKFFNGRVSRWIPFWGWTKGAVGAIVEGRMPLAILLLVLQLAGIAALCVIVWRMKADFYEEALAKSEEVAELQAAIKEEGRGVLIKRDKDRGEKIRRDEMRYGQGANVFFFKSLYNRFRFAKGRVLTKTLGFYFVAAVGVTLACKYIFQIPSVIPAALIIAVLVFYRSLGNPLSEDIDMDCFLMIPESIHAKLLYSLLGGSVNCLLDIALPLAASGLLMGGLGGDALSALKMAGAALMWIPFILGMDFFATSVGTFIHVSTPKNAGNVLKQLAQILFIYFGIIPTIGIIAAGFALGHLFAGIVISAVVNIVLGIVFFFLTPEFMGRA